MKSYVKHDSIIKNRMVVCGWNKTIKDRPIMPLPIKKAQLITCAVVIYNKGGIINEMVAMKGTEVKMLELSDISQLTSQAHIWQKIHPTLRKVMYIGLFVID